MLFPDRMRERVTHLVEWKELQSGLYDKNGAITVEETLAWADQYGSAIRDLICDTTIVLEEGASAGKNILFEAQLGTLRDLNFGIYPFTTSSCALAAYAPVGGGLFGHGLDRVMAVVKAFSTCVGEGPFLTRMNAEEANALREIAEEYGAATGRPRTIGHFDAVATRYGVRIQGATEVALTKLDSLSGLKSLKICTHYDFHG